VIIETIFSTLDIAGQPNFAPMGILWGDDEITVRPFRNTRTYANLIATRFGVANIIDDVLAFVRSALDNAVLPHFPAARVPGVVLQEACYWRELQVVAVAGGEERAEVRCQVVNTGWLRDFLGFNRAKSAVLEATILATRLHLHDHATVLEELERYEEVIRKTGDDAERLAFARVYEFVKEVTA
jgi:hypothetical protein